MLRRRTKGKYFFNRKTFFISIFMFYDVLLVGTSPLSLNSPML